MFIDHSNGRIIEFVNMTHMEMLKNYWLIEDCAFEVGIQRLLARNLLTDEIVYDDNASVDAILARYGIVSQTLSQV